jgi:flagellar biosynthesis protein FlhA
MDGAAKFVRGDAIAGICITVINIVGGIIIGVAQQSMSFQDASHTYTLLTVGDGLVSQIPALIVSTAAGMLVSKTTGTGSTDKAFFSQLSAYPSALGLSSFLMASLSMLPGIPVLPFLSLACVTGYAAWKLSEGQKETGDLALAGALGALTASESATEENATASALQIDQIRLELGYGLLSLVNAAEGNKLADQIKTLRKQLAKEIGFLLPMVRIQDNLQLPSDEYVLRIKEVESGRGSLRLHRLLAMDPEGKHIDLPGEPTTEPTFGLKASWIDRHLRAEAESKGYTVVDPLTVITTHLSEVIRDNTADLLSFMDTQDLLTELGHTHQKLISELIPTQITVSGLQRVLQNLLSERISIRDLPSILEAVSEACTFTSAPAGITEHVRTRLGRQICSAFSDESGILPLVMLSPEWENTLNQALMGEGESRQLALPPSKLQELTARITEVFDGQAMQGIVPVLLVSPALRPQIRLVLERFRPSTVVLSQAEIHPKARIKTVARL